CDVSTVSVTITASTQTVTVTAASSDQLATTTITTHSTSTSIITVTQVHSATEEPACRAWLPHRYEYYTNPSGVTHWKCGHSLTGTGPAISLTTTVRVIPSVSSSPIGSVSGTVSFITSESSTPQLGASRTGTEVDSSSAPTSMLGIPPFAPSQSGTVYLTLVSDSILWPSEWNMQTFSPSLSSHSEQAPISSVQLPTLAPTDSTLLHGPNSSSSALKPNPTPSTSDLLSEPLLNSLVPSSTNDLAASNTTSAGVNTTFTVTSTSKITLTVSGNTSTKSSFSG
ncbi:hypothetical protein LTS18_007747, partial [Coniosporium uncinatum]